MQFQKAPTLILLLALLFFPKPSHAASLLAACSGDFDISACPESLLFFPTYAKVGSKTPFKFKVDPSGLGDIDADTAYSSTIEVLDAWEAESNLDFQAVDDSKFDEDIDITNYDPILNPSRSLGFSPIVYDEDGSITDDLLGEGAKNNILGFAGAQFFTVKGNKIKSIKESQAVFNGYLYRSHGNLASVIQDFQSTILHEFGHMFGIDHSQGGNLEGFNNRSSDLSDVPIMFPIAANPLVELQKDDIAIVKTAYPLGDEKSLYGNITGMLLRNGSPLRGANVVAYKIDEVNPRKKAVASPSDIDGLSLGAFRLPNLDPGTYIIKAEPIDADFVEGSSIGINDPISGSRMSTGFYRGDGELALKTNTLSTGIAQAQQITVNPGSNETIIFDVGNKPYGSKDTSGATFTLSGRAISFRDGIYLKYAGKKTVELKITNPTPGVSKTINLSTDYPELIEFLPSDTITIKKKNTKIKVRFATFFDFVDVVGDLDELGIAFIPLTVEDQDSGYTNENEGFLVF